MNHAACPWSVLLVPPHMSGLLRETSSENWDRLKEAKGWPSLGVRAADNDGGGCEIERVYRQSAAEIGGLKRGDIISHVNKKQLRDVDALVAIIQSKRPGDKLELSLTRKGKKMTLVIELGTRQ